MTTLALIAIFSSAVFHAAWNALLKKTSDPAAASVVIVFGAASLTVLLAIFTGQAHVTSVGLPWLVATGLIEGLYFVTLSVALARLPLGTAYGISRGAGLLMVWPLSILLFHEVLDLRSGMGALLLGAGLLALVQGVGSLQGLAGAAGCAVAIALYPLGYKRALLAGIDPYPLFAISLGLALPVQLALLRTDRVARLGAAWRRDRSRLSLAAALCAASFLLFLVALQKNGPGRVTALRNSSVLFATLFGWWGGDRISARTASSAVLVAAGAVLLSWS